MKYFVITLIFFVVHLSLLAQKNIIKEALMLNFDLSKEY